VLEARYSNRTRGLWHSPSQAKQRFGLSQDTRSAGLQELELYGIVDRRTGPVSPGVFDMKRRRNIYDLHLEQLRVPPGQPRPAEEVGLEDLAVEGDADVAASSGAPPGEVVTGDGAAGRVSARSSAKTGAPKKRVLRKARSS
jgi:hypothetical protein